MRCLPFLLVMLASAVPATGDAWDDVLAGAGLTRETGRFNAADAALIGDGDYRLPAFDSVWMDPLGAPYHARALRTSLLAASANAGDLVMAGAARIGAVTRLSLLGDPVKSYEDLATKPGSFLAAYDAVWKAAGRRPSPKERRRVEAEAARLPATVARQAAMVLFAEVDALRWRRLGLGATGDLNDAFATLTGGAPWTDAFQPRYERLMQSVDLPRLMVGGELLALAADRAATRLAGGDAGGAFQLRAWTPLGWVVLRASGDDRGPTPLPCLLLIDTDGDDAYSGGAATQSPRFPVSVLIDVRGNDRYVNVPALEAAGVMSYPGRKGYKGPPSFGAGIFGYGILVDAAGNDLYRSIGDTQGRAWFGVGLLQDRAGNDTYDAYRTAQGCGDWGVGALSDLGGDDTYACLQNAQGYGGTKGFGVLLDAGLGDDRFTAEDSLLDDPSAQTKEHNTSMAQGVGNGRRADYSDGHSMAGGVGVLLDDGGANTLAAGVFAQGTGYWMGVGYCLLGPGPDALSGAWYVQGSAAHFAVGVLDDLAGDDERTATHNMAQGAGHDFSVGWLVDHAGNDRSTAPNLSLGSGNASGFGFFWDRAGNDTYAVKPSVTLGGASGGSIGSVRERNPTLGIFLDSGGRDDYPETVPQARDGTSWRFRRGERGKTADERGSGIDSEAPDLGEPN